MKAEDYVSLEVAKLLKEKGYNEPCFRVFTPLKKEEYRLSRRYPAETNEDICHLEDGCAFDEYLAPSLAQAAKWLREKHNIAICPVPYSSYWDYTIFDLKNFRDDNCNHKILGSRVAWSSYEESLNEGIKESLKLIKDD